MVPASRRLGEVFQLVERKSYFTVHAPRQIGKTTTLLAIARELTAAGGHAAVLVSMETGAGFPDDIGAAELAVLTSWRNAASEQLPPALHPPPWPDAPPGSRIGEALRAWSEASQRPLVVFLDEIDALRNGVLLSVLRQLRDGYRNRPRRFPWALALVGLRDVRDYQVAVGERDHLGTASPFNIKVRSLTLGDFTVDEVRALYGQHSADTGQVFAVDALERVVHYTGGQPWLVNALAAVAIDVLVPDRSEPITAAVVERAVRVLIDRRDTHLDSLAERLRDPRVRNVLAPLIAGATPPTLLDNDEIRYAIDLGLVKRTDAALAFANPIYQEIVSRELFFAARSTLPPIDPSWRAADGRLDRAALLSGFLAFWRRHGEPLMRTAQYHEIAAQLVLMAFLDRVANGGGAVEREYAIGSGRLDLCLRLGDDRLAIEVKVWREGEPDPRAEGLEQIDRYLAGLGLRHGWLVIFDRRPGLARLSERTVAEPATTPGGRAVDVVRA